jgi:transposase
MDHIAIDLGGRQSQLCVRSSDGALLVEERVATAELPQILSRRPPSLVVMETCAESRFVARAAARSGHRVCVVPATLVRALGVGARGTKTDRRDARLLSEASCRMNLPSVHIPREESCERKALCAMRESIVESRTKLINSVRGWARQSAARLPGGGVGSFTQRVRRWAAQQHIALPGFVGRQLETIEQLHAQILKADRELDELAKDDAVCVRLMTVPGVGPVTAVRFAAAIDDVQRFQTAHDVASYFGLVPGERQSGDRRQRTGITKAGNPKVRWALIQAAWVARRTAKDDPMVRWSLALERRHGRRAVAVVALARKMAGLLFALLRDGTVYDASRAALPPIEP